MPKIIGDEQGTGLVAGGKKIGCISDNAEWTWALKTGTAALCTAFILGWIDFKLAAIPLAVFVVVCFAAPFFPRWGFYMPVISKGRSGKQAVALTFDDGPDPDVTPGVIDLLAKHRIPATFFVSGHRAAVHPGIIRKIVENGHGIGNHSYHHSFLFPFKSRKKVFRDIQDTQVLLETMGVRPLVFRPPGGIVGPRLQKPVQRAGLAVVNFSCRANDLGNKRIAGIADRILKRIHPDAIVMLHDIAPAASGRISPYLAEIERLVLGIERKGYTVLPLAEIIGRPVMHLDDSRKWQASKT